MLLHPQINPVVLRLGPLNVHWYGLTYLLAFALFFFLATRRLRQPPFAGITQPAPWRRQDVEDLLFWGVVGVIAGGRIGYCLFYKPAYYLSHPLEVFYLWQGGMSFHGGMLGVIFAMFWWAWRRGRPWLQVTDLIAPCVPLGLAAGRIGNFINGELWGRVADPSLPWAMVFPHAALPDGSNPPRHPSQLYQFALEGVLLFILLWLYARSAHARAHTGRVSGAFLIGYGSLRFVAEFFREPDAHLGLLGLGMSMGQWLCVPMLLAGVWLMTRRPGAEAAAQA